MLNYGSRGSTGPTSTYRYCHFSVYIAPIYYDRFIDHDSVSFADLIQTGEVIEDSLKIEKIKDYQSCLSKLQVHRKVNEEKFPK